MNISDICMPNRTAFIDNHAAFYAVFHRDIHDFWDGNLLGFDVIKFDSFIAPDNNESTYDAIGRRFGQRGVDIVKALLHAQ